MVYISERIRWRKTNALSIIVVVEEIEKWEAELVQMLYSDEKNYLQSALILLDEKFRISSEHEKSVLANNAAINSRIRELEVLFAEDVSIQQSLKEYNRKLEGYNLSGEAREPVSEISSISSTAKEVLKVPYGIGLSKKKTSEEMVQMISSEVSEEISNRWLWLGLLFLLLLILVGVVVRMTRR